MGKTRVIAETGAGQHGVATATAAALMGMECEIVTEQKADLEKLYEFDLMQEGGHIDRKSTRLNSSH